MKLDLHDPQAFRAAFAEHSRSVYAAAYRVLGDAALAQDVVQDVYLRIWGVMYKLQRRVEGALPTRGKGRGKPLEEACESEMRSWGASESRLACTTR